MKLSLKSVHLKWISISMMIVGEVLRQFIYQFTIGNGVEPLPWQTIVYYVGYVLYLGAFPISAFLLVEGAKKTSNQRFFLGRLCLAGLVTELLLDVALYGRELFSYGRYPQNYFFTLLLGLLVIYLVEALARYIIVGSFWYNLITLVLYIIVTIIVTLLQLEQGSLGILVIIALHVCYGNRLFSLILVAVLYLLFLKGIGIFSIIPAFSLLLLWFYQGVEGKKARWFFYLAYPGAYLMLGLLVRFL